MSRETSDIDILVELERPVGFKYFELWDELEKMLGLPVDMLTIKGGKAKAITMGKYKRGSNLCLNETGNYSFSRIIFTHLFL